MLLEMFARKKAHTQPCPLPGMIKQFLRDVDWGDVDYLIIDTPPGTSDEHLSVVQYLAAAHIDGAVVLTTPQVSEQSDDCTAPPGSHGSFSALWLRDNCSVNVARKWPSRMSEKRSASATR